MPQPYHSAGGKGSSAPHHGAGTTVRGTPQPAKVQQAGCGVRVKGARCRRQGGGHAVSCIGAGSRVR